jgi:hypothetical protein
MCPYYPKSRILTSQTTKGKEFLLPSGNTYKGNYYITYDGKYITGDNPTSKNQQILSKINQEINSNKLSNQQNNQVYRNLNNIDLEELIDPNSYIPIISGEDYKLGKITRYFAKKRQPRGFVIIEIDRDSFTDIKDQKGIYNYAKWDVTSLLWQISGPLNNELKEGNIVRAGILDTNKRIVDLKNKNFIGVKEYLTDLSKFSKK